MAHSPPVMHSTPEMLVIMWRVVAACRTWRSVREGSTEPRNTPHEFSRQEGRSDTERLCYLAVPARRQCCSCRLEIELNAG